MQGFAYFPTVVYRDEQPDLAHKVLPVCRHYLDQARTPDTNMVQSAHVAEEPAMQELTKYLLVSAVDILKEQGYIVEKYEFYLSGLWVQELGKWAGTNVHVHGHSQICGWFFLEAPQGGAYPVYHDPRMNKAVMELEFNVGPEVNNAIKEIHFNNMVPGTAMFSNSWMQHQLVGGNSDAPTRCVHFIVSHRGV